MGREWNDEQEEHGGDGVGMREDQGQEGDGIDGSGTATNLSPLVSWPRSNGLVPAELLM